MRKRRLPTLLLVSLLALPVQAQHKVQKRLPVSMDLCKDQTPIRNQGGRDTCPYFPPVAALEAAYNRMGVKVDLSVEHLIWLRDAACSYDKGNRDMCENMCSTLGGGGGDILGVLQHYAICRDQDLPYVFETPGDVNTRFELKGYEWSKPFSQFALNRWNLDPRQLPRAARTNARYAVEKFVTMPSEDRKNPRKFEEILDRGHEIIFALYLHDNSDDSARGEPVWRLKPHTRRRTETIKHFMLMVGYNRHRRFFVVKNQWGPTNYSGHVNKLGRDWKDVVKYDGYTLIDYNYLAECDEALYITAVAPVGSPRFTAQRALGQWQVTFSQNDKPMMTGVLCWRHVPSLDGPKPNLRIGDLVTRDGMQYRVNAKLESDGATTFKANLSIDFDAGYLPSDSTGGTAWTGELSLPETGGGTLSLNSASNGKRLPWGAPAAGAQLTAKLVENENLLFGIHLPSNSTGPR
jgi:hypothetical protein